MEMVTVPVTIPKGLEPYIPKRDKPLSLEQGAMLLYPLIQNLVISHGRAAELLGVHKWDLIECYGKLGIPYINMTEEELDEEIEGYSRLLEQRKA